MKRTSNTGDTGMDDAPQDRDGTVDIDMNAESSQDGDQNVDPDEIARFNRVAAHWWDPEGDFKALHDINPLRANYIDERSGGIAGKGVLDIGCGGGLLSEALGHRGATVLGIDRSSVAIDVATQRGTDTALHNVSYQLSSIEELSAEKPEPFEVITCLEMLEHVPDPQAIIAAAYSLLAPGGHLYVSTINRNPKAFAQLIVGAEYVLGLIPKGTHEYAKLIRPSELAAWGRWTQLSLRDQRGIHYNPLTRGARLTNDVSVNYIMHFTKEA